MKAKGSRVCSGAIVLFVFVCLLLAGAGRLIASEGDGQRMPDLSQRQAWLCAAPNAAQEPLTDARQEIRPGGEHRFAFSANREGQRAAALLQRRDANGNILPGSESYMKTVYRAFPLGDGFAYREKWRREPFNNIKSEEKRYG